MNRLTAAGLMTIAALVCTAAIAAPPEILPEGRWALAFEDDFGGAVAEAPAARAPGDAWLPLRGDWFVTPQGRLRVQRVWPSGSAVMLELPLRAVNVRAEMDVIVAADDVLVVQLQSGEPAWGGGGVADTVAARISGKEVTPDVPHRLMLELVDGRYRIELDGKTLREGEAPQGRSLFNHHLALTAMPNGEIDNLRIHTQPQKKTPAALRANTPAENRQATIDARQYMDVKAPDCGFQRAIDALPAGGGAVVLPEGRFVLRRHLHLPSHVTLRGQGAGRTILVHCDTAASPIVSSSSEAGRHTVTLADASAFRAGDAVCFNGNWDHPAGEGDENQGILVLAVDGDTLSITEPVRPPPEGKTLVHFFPLVYAREAEYVEVKDLTLLGPAENPAGAVGRFMVNPVGIHKSAAARVTRVEIDGFPADGVSVQAGNDHLVTDNTVRNTAQGFHPGTVTTRFLWSRNLSLGNGAGLFFCWYNTRGVYTRSTYAGMTGYPGQGDFHNVIAFNRDDKPFLIENGASGVYYGNHVPAIALRFRGKATRHLYEAPPRYFVIAGNTTEAVRLEKGGEGAGPLGNVIAGNVRPGEKPAPAALELERLAREAGENVVEEAALIRAAGLVAVGVERTAAVAPPALPEPVLEGAAYYDPDAADAGFGKALAELAQRGGGTLRLPAGRYHLRQPLTVPANVTLAGQGVGTVLVVERGSAILVKDAAGVVLRELTLEGPWPARLAPNDRQSAPAVHVEAAPGVQLLSLDVRGVAGAGIAVRNSPGALLQDCRAIACAGDGLMVGDSAGAQITAGIATGNGGHGISVAGPALIDSCIAARNAGAGFNIQGGAADGDRGATVTASNASDNEGPGIALAGVYGARVIANLAVNNQVGIVVGPDCRDVAVLYNRCGDDRIVPRQTIGIDAPAAAGAIRYNVLSPHHAGYPPREPAGSSDSLRPHNITKTILPTGTSFEDFAADSR